MRWMVLAVFGLGCRADLDGHWQGEACGEGSGFEMAFDLTQVEGTVGRDRVWAGTGTLIHPCLEHEDIGWSALDGSVVCEWDYALAMKHHNEKQFTGWLFTGFDGCGISEVEDHLVDPCPFGLFRNSMGGGVIRTRLWYTIPTPIEGAETVTKDCEMELVRTD